MDIRLEFEDTGDWTCRALVDSGAPRTVFDRAAADAIGVRINNAGARSGSIRIMGGSWSVQFEMVELSLVDIPDSTWTAEVAFVKSPEFRMPFQGVLGTEGFLDRFAVTLNCYHNYFVVEGADDYHDRVGQHLIADPVVSTDAQWERPTMT